MKTARVFVPASDASEASETMAICFRPMGEVRTWPVATAWLDGRFVLWSSPRLDHSHEHANVEAFEHKFGDCACTFPAFMRSMNWLDSVCFAASGLEEVIAACKTNPEYGLVCVRAEGLSETLGNGEPA